MDIAKLQEILENQLEQYQKELDLADKRVELIRENDLEGLNKVILEERALGDEIKSLEDTRVNLFKNTKYEKLTDLIDDLSEDNLKFELLNLKNELLSIITEIKSKNELCSKLIEISSEMVSKLMNELTGKKEVGYNKYRKKENISSNNLLNTKG